MVPVIRIIGEDADQTRQLLNWLQDDPSVHRYVAIEAEDPNPEHLGVSGDVVLTVLAPGGVAMAIVGGLFAWLRSRKSDISLQIVTKDGREMQLKANAVGRIPASAVPAMIEAVAAWVVTDSPDQDDEGRLVRMLNPAVENERLEKE